MTKETEVMQTQEDSVISIENLSKSYGTKKALDSISFSVKKGEIVGFLGPNGAGKSTTMNILTGYLAPGQGRILIDGIDIAEDPKGARQKIGYLPEQPPLYFDMTVREYLNFVYDLKGVKKANRNAHLRKVMEKMQISDVQGRMIRNLSKGYRQRVGLAQALIGDPEVLILDEPTVGLDPKQIMEIRQVIHELGQNRTVILSTHILQEVNAVCDSYVIINHGKIVATGAMNNWKKDQMQTQFLLQIQGDSATGCEILQTIDGVEKVERRGSHEIGTADLLVTAKPHTDIREQVFRQFAKADCPILSFASATPSMEEMFMKLIRGEEMDEETVTNDMRTKGDETI